MVAFKRKVDMEWPSCDWTWRLLCFRWGQRVQTGTRQSWTLCHSLVPLNCLEWWWTPDLFKLNHLITAKIHSNIHRKLEGEWVTDFQGNNNEAVEDKQFPNINFHKCWASSFLSLKFGSNFPDSYHHNYGESCTFQLNNYFMFNPDSSHIANGGAVVLSGTNKCVDTPHVPLGVMLPRLTCSVACMRSSAMSILNT